MENVERDGYFDSVLVFAETAATMRVEFNQVMQDDTLTPPRAQFEHDVGGFRVRRTRLLTTGGLKSRFLFLIVFLLLAILGACTRVADKVEERIAELKSPNPSVRRNAALALADLGDKRAVEPLIACLKDWDSSVRLNASAALLFLCDKMRDRLTVEPLIACLKDQDFDVRWNAVNLLVKLGDKRAVEPLIAHLKDQDLNVRRNAAWALGHLRDERAVEPLIVCMEDQNPSVRGEAAMALGGLGDARAVKPLIIRLKDWRSDVRWNAATALGKLGYNPVVDHEKAVYLGALQQWDELVKLGPAAIEPLIGCLKDQDRRLGRDAAKLLGKLGDARAVEPLIACLKEHDWNLRERAAEALGKLGDARAVESLRAALPDWEANAAIGSALEKLGWQPASDSEKVYLWICKRDNANLKAHWKKTKQVLLADVKLGSGLKSGSGRKVENAVYAFVSIGLDEIVSELIRILEEEGNAYMAETYSNCDHDGLKKAARAWALQNGRILGTMSVEPKARWGQW